ncbi:unnamed protein product [Cylindrotheca closterium]|uniref:NFACT RNA-binding domain-containing protein n=1 Tax=Cylindrotheca closterium TaxID=2856 RepID=A0AAD2G6M0_9STRA|nr:unnamed protein product [Cylindrotheca closterium]
MPQRIGQDDSFSIPTVPFRNRGYVWSQLRMATFVEESTSSWDEPDLEDELSHDNEQAEEVNESPLLEEYQDWSKALKKAVKALEKKRKSLQSEYEKAQGVEDTVARAQLLVSNLYHFNPGVKTATVQDWENDGAEVELTLNPKYASANEEADALFAQARKLKRGSQIVKELLNESEQAWELLSDAQADLESACMDDGEINQGRLALVQDRLQRSSRATKFQPPLPRDAAQAKSSSSQSNGGKSNRKQSKPEIGTPQSNLRKLMSPGGCIVLVGRNRRGNEHLSMSIARGNDVWMHSRGCPGAHVIIQNRRGSPKPTPECLAFAADLAIYYSDFRNEVKAPVTTAEPKHLQKPRGAPLGAIKVRQESETLIGYPARVPDELKEARAASGQSDEYRSTDKAKHRKRTKQVAQQERAKRKKANKEKKAAAERPDFY